MRDSLPRNEADSIADSLVFASVAQSFDRAMVSRGRRSDEATKCPSCRVRGPGHLLHWATAERRAAAERQNGALVPPFARAPKRLARRQGWTAKPSAANLSAEPQGWAPFPVLFWSVEPS
ncbi:hypothetical protein VTN96DRAFT_3259 [Rasamsonia emersonii]